nr:hypothetical protein CFP56_18581 [Quercus suber]
MTPFSIYIHRQRNRVRCEEICPGCTIPSGQIRVLFILMTQLLQSISTVEENENLLTKFLENMTRYSVLLNNSGFATS